MLPCSILQLPLPSFLALCWCRNCVFPCCFCVAAAGGKAKESQATVDALDPDLRCAVLVLSVIAIVSPASVSRDTCVRLVNILLQMVDTPHGLVSENSSATLRQCLACCVYTAEKYIPLFRNLRKLGFVSACS